MEILVFHKVVYQEPFGLDSIYVSIVIITIIVITFLYLERTTKLKLCKENKNDPNSLTEQYGFYSHSYKKLKYKISELSVKRIIDLKKKKQLIYNYNPEGKKK